MTVARNQLTAEFTDKQLEKLDELIKTTVNETEDAEDGKQYLADIIYDLESDIGLTLTEEQEAKVKEYAAQEIERLHGNTPAE